jgi:hypothetical protein
MVRGRNSSTVDSSPNRKRLPDEPGKIPEAEVAGNLSGGGKRFNKENQNNIKYALRFKKIQIIDRPK